MPVGIIGLGVVGGAMYRGFKAAGCEVLGYDIDPDRSQHGFEAALAQEVVLVSVPTPANGEGRCDLSPVHSVFERAALLGVRGLLVLRSTVPVGTTAALISRYPALRIGFSPEFLRKNSADHDFLNPPMTVFGGDDPQPYFDLMKTVVKNPGNRWMAMSPSEAELVKLLLNGFAAVKAVFSSELAEFARSMNVDWEKVVATAQPEGRLGRHYLAGAGSDGLPGFGGSCLPKDCRMLARQIGAGSILDHAIEINTRIRGDDV